MTSRTSRYLLLSLAMALALLGGVTWLNLRADAAARESAALVARTHAVRFALSELLSSAQDLETGARGYILTGQAGYLEPFDAALARQAERLRALRTLAADAQMHQEPLDTLEQLIRLMAEHSERMVRLRRADGFAAAQAEVASGRGKAAMDAVRAMIARIDAAEATLLAERVAALRFNSLATRRVILAATAVVLAMLVASFALVLRENRRRLQSEHELDRFFSLSLDLLCIAGADGYFKRVSPAFTRALGWSADEILATPFLDLVHPDDRPATLRAVEQMTKAGERLLRFENRYRHKDGTSRVISWNAVPQPGGLMFATGRDVTEEREVRRTISGLRRHLELLVTSVADGLHELDLAGQIVFENPAAERMFGYAHGEMLGRPAHPTIHHHRADGSDYPVDQCPIYTTLRDGETRTVQDEVFWRSDGTSFPVEYVVSPINDEQGSRMGAVVVFRDITARRAAEDALQVAHDQLAAANQQLAQVARLKDEFLANMSHELRTPLNSILGLSETLLEQVAGPLTERQYRSVTTIAESGAHLLALINDILDLSKIEAGKLELHPRSLDVGEFCQSCLAFVRSQAMQKHIGVAFEHDPRAAHVLADPRRLKQILVNLLTNAVKFTPERGNVGLTVTAPAGEDAVRFTVWDTGIGIAAADQPHLFQAFTQIDSGLNRAQEGSGLGLALVEKLVALHGGQIALESEPGAGSRFTVTLPQSSDPATAVQPETQPAGRTAAQPAAQSAWSTGANRQVYRRALIIEDDPTAAAMIEKYLAELGLSSVCIPDGEGAVEAALREQPDVILLDILFPGESGWVALARLKYDPGTRHIPVVVVSVVDEPEKSRALGAEAHFTKPVTRDQLATFFGRATAGATRVTPQSRAQRRIPAEDARPLILLAEDNQANMETIGGYLEDNGFDLRYARDGAEAVALARALKPALILMDIQMPRMDGLAAIRELRADAGFADVPIVALTALAMPGDRERCLEAGATDYVSKPVSLKALTALVRRLLHAER